MKPLIVTILLLLLSKFNIYSQKLNCKDFRTGKFELIDEQNNHRHVYERFEDYQTEETFDIKTGNVIEEKGFYIIKWINDCEYNLKLDTSRTKATDIALEVNSRGGVNSKIALIEGNCAILIVKIGDENFDDAYGMCKVN